MRRTLRALAVTASLATTLAVAACGSGSHDTMTGMNGMGTSPGAASSAPSSASAGDVMFAQMMVPHHHQAVEMADLALARSQSTRLKSLAADIKAAQGPEITTMNGWLREWGAPATAGGMDHGTDGMMSDADMAALRQAGGQAFDRMWLTMMVAHHEGAVTMAENVLATTKNPQVRTLAQDVVDAQAKEISTMKGMLAG